MTAGGHLSHGERNRIVAYIVSVTEEIARLEKEIDSLEPFIHYDVKAYRKYKLKISARDAMKEQLEDVTAALRAESTSS